MKEVCWSLQERGAVSNRTISLDFGSKFRLIKVGETVLHLCFLNGTFAAAELAKRLLHHFPKLINDFYTSDEYYGWLRRSWSFRSLFNAVMLSQVKMLFTRQ